MLILISVLLWKNGSLNIYIYCNYSHFLNNLQIYTASMKKIPRRKKTVKKNYKDILNTWIIPAVHVHHLFLSVSLILIRGLGLLSLHQNIFGTTPILLISLFYCSFQLSATTKKENTLIKF